MISEEERERRREGIGSSDLFYILGGKDKYKTDRDIYAEKVGLKEDRTTSFPAEIGSAMEAFIAERDVRPYVEAHWPNVGSFVEPERLSHPDLPHVFANADRILLCSEGAWHEIFEIKFVGHHTGRDFGTDWTQEYPEKFRYQMIWQMLVARANGYPVERVHLCAMISNERVFWSQVRWDEAEAADILERALDWWNKYVLTETLPPQDGTAEDLAALERIFGGISDVSEVEADEDMEEKARQLDLKQQAFLKLGDEITALKCDLLSFMEGHDRLVGQRFSLWNKPRKGRKSTSWKALAMSFKPSEEQVAEHTKIGKDSKSFRFTFNNGEDNGN